MLTPILGHIDMKLSKPLIASLFPGNRDRFYWDESLPGFGVRVKPSGIKTFVLQYRNASGSSRRLTLGRVGVITLDQARKEAQRNKGLIGFGQDPAQNKAEARVGETLADLASRYMSEHCEGRCKPSTLAAHRWLLEKFILPRLRTQKVKDIKQEDVARLHQSLRTTPYNANRVLGLLRAMFNKAEEWGALPKHGNPAESVSPFTERKRQRFLSPDEFNRLYLSVDELERLGVIGTYQAAAIRLLSLTGCRLSEILTLEWKDIDLGNQRLLLSHHKTDRQGAKMIPLNSSAQKIVSEIPVCAGNPFVIIGRDGTGHLINLQKPWNRVRQHAGLSDVRIHDLRHSFASAAVSAGISLPIIGGLLGHSSLQSTARYAHLAQDPVHRASELVGRAINGKSNPVSSDGEIAGP